LCLQHLVKAIRPQRLRLEAIEMEAVLRLEEGMEERNALNMIPVVMGNQNMGFDGAATELLD